MKNNIVIQKIVVLLLIVINLLNMVTDRGMAAGSVLNEDSEANSRIYIQLLNGIVIFFLFFIVLKNRKRYFIGCTYICYMIIMLAIYLVLHLYAPTESFNLANYIRMFMSFIAIIAFYNFNFSEHITRKLMQIFVLTFITQESIKIISSQVFLADRLNAGDTASIGLVFVLPLVFLFFKNKMLVLLTCLCIGGTLLSLRRTSILAIAFMFVFIWPMFKNKITKWIKLVAVVLIVGTIGFMLTFLQDSLVVRFMELGESGTAGSGREFFWAYLLNDLFSGNNWLLGNGLGVIGGLFTRYGMEYLNHAHNDFLELAYTFGILGLLIWIIFLWRYFGIMRLITNPVQKSIFKSCIVAYLVVAVSSGCIMRFEFLPLAMSMATIVNRYNPSVS